MRRTISRAVDWIDQRTGVHNACARFLFEEIPASAGWPHVFGSVALFLVLVQALTGILLAFDYAPTPGDAYRSLTFIVQQVAGGRMIHGLHHWGASLMIIVVFLHMAQVFIFGAYKKPREVTWIAGSFLLLVTLAFGLTGYLLPWDNRAYWGTVVTTRIMGSVPVIGAFLVRLTGATNGIGVLTFARFYALHTLVLPALTVLLTFVHVYLVRRHGITASASINDQTQRFFPKQAFRDTVAIFVTFAALFVAAAVIDVPLERLADPTDTTYIPRPEWYFLFLFELLKIFRGSLEPIGTVVLPTTAILLLVATPFIAGKRLSMLNRRSAAVSTVVLVVALWGTLTVVAERGPATGKRPQFVPRAALEWALVPPEEIAGLGYFRSSGCSTCHNLVTETPKAGPNLISSEHRHPKEWLIVHFNHPDQGGTDDGGPRNYLSLPQLNALSTFVSNVSPDSLAALQPMSSQFIKGAQIYVSRGCPSCHKVNGTGGGIGPPLNGLFDRHGRQWVEAHFAAPRRLSPGSIMPPYSFSQEEKEDILLYLFSLPE